MASTTPKSYFWKGFLDALPMSLVAGSFGLLFGVLATEAGLDLLAIMSFSMAVFAGAAQFAALQLMQEQAPTLIVLASALAVNLRMAMYSASLTPHLGDAPLWQRGWAAFFLVDQSYACSTVRFETEPEMTTPQKMAYYFGTVAPIAPVWYLCAMIGALAGTRIPESWALDFALPIAFLAMVMPMLRTPAHVVAALVAVIVSLAAAGLPYNLGLLVAGLAGMIAGARTEVALAQREKTA